MLIVLIIIISMQPIPDTQNPQQQPVFKGDIGSVSSTIESFLKGQTDYYMDYLKTLKTQSFDVASYNNWRFVENKANPHRFFLPLVDAVILDLYVLQNLTNSQDQGFHVDADNYALFKDSVRQNLAFLDPYLMTCSFTQTPPSYIGYEQWVMYNQTRGLQVQNFKQQLIPLNNVTYREDVFNAFVADENNQLDVGAYVKFYDRFVQEQQTVEHEYDSQIKQLRQSIEGINLFVFNDYVEVCQAQGIQPTKETYLLYFEDVAQKYDAEYLKSKHEEIQESQKGDKKEEKGKKDERLGDMDDEEEDLAVELDDIEEGREDIAEEQQKQQQGQVIGEKDLNEKIELSKQCKCCKGNVYDCQGEVCQLLGNCICLSE